MTHYEFFKRFYARFNKRNTFRKGTSEKAICPSIKFIKNTALCYLFKLNWIYLDDQIALPSPIVNKLPSNYTTGLHNNISLSLLWAILSSKTESQRRYIYSSMLEKWLFSVGNSN